MRFNIKIMNIKCSLDQFPPDLGKSYYRSIEVVFHESFDKLSQKTDKIVSIFNEKPLIKCYLIPASLPQPKYDGVILGGTFDYLHIGHQLLLLTAILLAKYRIVIGVTGQAMLQKKKNKELIQHFTVRQTAIEQYVRTIKPNLQLEIVQLHDIYGPAIVREDVGAIIVSEQTKIGGQKINEVRKQKNLKQLIIEECPLASRSSKVEEKMSSTHVRNYILDKNRMSVDDLKGYKSRWMGFNERLEKYFGMEACQKQMERWWDKILQSYSQYWRYYHTNAHILQLLQQLQQNTHKDKLNQFQQIAIEAAIWFHDIQYLPISKQNEEESAKICQLFFNSFHPLKNQQHWLNFKKLVKQSILDTKTHKAESQVSKILIDIDMSILDSLPESYLDYAQNVKKQYKPSVGELYNEKRATFLKNLKLNEVFYYHKPTNLTSNIKAELNALGHKQTNEL